MKHHIAFYCPDRHLTYNLHTLEQRGVGGGITSRIRLSHALAERGHQVAAYVNCPSETTIGNVRYRHCGRVERVETDIFVVGTSGGGQDLTPLSRVRVSAQLRVLMVHGVAPPKGLERLAFDFVYAPSNFIRDIVVEQWGIPASQVFVCHRGVVRGRPGLGSNRGRRRDPFALAYVGHPAKGYGETLAVLRLLREVDSRFRLHVYGGHGLWGETEQPLPHAPGVIYHGLIGQRRLARELTACGFSLNLQARQEPFGLAVVEAMRAGCIVLASPVGAYPEIIRHGYDGFLIPGSHADLATQRRAADLILALIEQPDYADYIRRNAMAAPLDWDEVARAWEGHWNWALGRRAAGDGAASGLGACRFCGGDQLPLADGLHCTRCGRYARSMTP